MLRRFIKFSLLAFASGFIVMLPKIGEIRALAYASGPDPSLTGAPSFTGIPAELNCTDCHSSFGLNSGAGTFKVAAAPTSYVPGQTYTITVSLFQANRAKYGFEITALDSAGKPAGTFTITDATRTQLVTSSYSGGTRTYVEQKNAGTAATTTNQADWSFSWKAPATNVGKITFYSAGIAANGSGSSGDYVYTTSKAVTPSPTTVSSADYVAANGVASGGAASVFGAELATTTLLASTTPLPTTLGGTTVNVTDALNVTKAASLFYVSPTQINFQIPDGLASGTATVVITNSANVVSSGTVSIVNVVPGIFTLTSDGKGLPVAQLQRIRGTTDLGFENTFAINGTSWASVPIAWNDPNDNVYLVIYCNGVRHNSGLSGVSVNLAGNSLPVVYAGIQPYFTGVDQVNVLLPKTFAGSGNVNMSLTVDGKTSNTVTINFK